MDKFYNWYYTNIKNHKSKKEKIEYLDEAFAKVWYMRSDPDCEAALPGIEKVITKYPEVLDMGEWDYGYWSGVLSTLRWVLGDEEKDNLDT